MKNKKIPLRRCVGCGEMKPKGELIRVVRTPEDEIVLDASGRANGRGAYLCKSVECCRKAMKNKGLERALKCRVSQEILEELEQEMMTSVT